jgi:hypothetical protein
MESELQETMRLETEREVEVNIAEIIVKIHKVLCFLEVLLLITEYLGGAK